MSSRALSMLFLFVASLAVGVAVGEWFFHLFLRAVPPVALSDFNTQSSRIAHWLYGACVGLVLFAWGLIGMMIGRIGKRKTKTAN